MSVHLVAAVLSALAPVSTTCEFEKEPRGWTRQALESWDRLDRTRIHMARPSTPILVLFDQNCVYRLTPAVDGDFGVGRRTYSVSAQPHSGMIDLPGGRQVPARKLSFASPSDDGGMFFVMSLPSLWRADAAETRNPDHLAMVVFMHEFAHTQQGEGLGRRIDELIASGLPQETNDDSLQAAWSSNQAYVAAYEHGRDLLYQAASAGTAEQRRLLLAEAAAAIAVRRNRFLADEPLWREADDVFLTFEGSGNWAAWAWLTDSEGGALEPDQAAALVRGAGRWWSQEEGLGAMLALDGLTPDWPSLAFSAEGVTVNTLIERALERD